MLTYPNPAKLEPNRKRLNHKDKKAVLPFGRTQVRPKGEEQTAPNHTKTQSVKAYESTFCAVCLPSGMHAETSVDKKGTVSLFRSEESKLSPFLLCSESIRPVFLYSS